MAETFYPFVETAAQQPDDADLAAPATSARIAVYDDMAMVPRVVSIEPTDIRTFLDEITKNVFELAKQQGGDWSFMVIRELVENFIHASFEEVAISILDRGQTLVFSDQGPGIPNKQAALKPSFSSATRPMKRYIRGVGSGLPIVEEQLKLRNGSITIEDNLGHGTIVTVSLLPEQAGEGGGTPTPEAPGASPTPQAGWPAQQQSAPINAAFCQPGYTAQTPAGYPQQYQQPAWPQQQGHLYQQQAYQPYPQAQPWPAGAPQQPAWSQQQAYQYPPQAPAQPWPPQQQTYQYQPYPQAQPAATPAPAAAFSPLDTHAPLTAQQRSILALFSTHDKIGPSELQECLCIASATGSRRLNEIARAGYVVKSGQKYVLTGEGERMLALLSSNEA